MKFLIFSPECYPRHESKGKPLMNSKMNSISYSSNEAAPAHSECCVVMTVSLVHEGPSASILADHALIDRSLGLSH